MKKTFVLILAFFLLSALVYAGGNKEITNSFELTDMAGRKVAINKEPKRIVSGYYISSSACIALGLKDNIVAVESQADTRPIYKLAAPELIEYKNVGTAKAFDMETCLASEPDLVILPLKQKATADVLQEMGIPAIVVNPENHEQMLEMIDLIGKACNCTKKSSKLINIYKEKLEFIEKKVSSTSERPVVYITGTKSYLTTAPKDMYQATLISSAGAVNAGDIIEGSSWSAISYEMLLTMDPDIIIIPTNSNADGTPSFSAENILNDAQLKDIKAVKNKAIYQMPVGFEAWDSPVPSGILGALWILKTVHPELYSNENFVKDVKDFYKTFYDFEADIK